MATGAQPRPAAKRFRTDAVDALYDVAPGVFIAARNRLVARLRKQGRASAATAVRRLRPLSGTVWAINRLARRDPRVVGRLLVAFEGLRDAQLRRGREEIRWADAEVRVAAEAAVDRTARYMRDAGLSISAVTRRRMDATLRGAAVYEREAFREGVLTDDLVAPGFDLFAVPHLRALPRPPSKAKRLASRGISYSSL